MSLLARILVSGAAVGSEAPNVFSNQLLSSFHRGYGVGMMGLEDSCLFLKTGKPDGHGTLVGL